MEYKVVCEKRRQARVHCSYTKKDYFKRDFTEMLFR